ncbi:MAG: class I SAM-dependent methyltransferase [Paracoccaceae bacterium]
MDWELKPVGGSFRDPAGHVYDVDDHIFRTVSEVALAEFEFVRESGLHEKLFADKRLVASELVPAGDAATMFPGAAAVIEHPKIDFISYPYEWCFSGLKDAALMHLDIQLEALGRGIALSDASAYNIQFEGTSPYFIDVLSFRRYISGEFWTGHRQFCEQFLNPLLLRALVGIPHNSWYRGTLEGIPTSEIARILPFRHAFSLNVLTQVFLQARLERQALRNRGKVAAAIKKKELPEHAYRGLLIQLRRWIAKLKPRDSGGSVWGNYAGDNTYSTDETTEKEKAIAEFVSATRANTVWDLGCNTGNYSIAALRGGALKVVGFDFDQIAIEGLYQRAKTEGHNILPLWLDATNQSPSQGWRQAERMGLNERASADVVLALAFVHHLAIGRNIPLGEILDWFVNLAPRGVIEFVQKDDPTVQEMLALRKDIFPHYNEDAFRDELSKRAHISREVKISASDRILFFFEA